MKKLLYILALILVLAVLVACNEEPATPGTSATGTTANVPTGSSTTGTTANKPSEPDKPQDITITGVTFEGKTVTYNGEEHTVTVAGTLPTGVSVTYENNKGANAGTYTATATLSGEGYVTLVLNATLTVERAVYDMSGAAWTAGNFTYTGSAQGVTVTGLPSGVTVADYTDNEKTDAGKYTAKVSFNYDTVNYEKPALADCAWEIKKADFVGITFPKESFDYDGTAKYIEIQGILPNGSNVSYACKENSAMQNSAIEIGTYTVTATVTNPNFNTLVLEAKMTIKGSEDERFIVWSNGVLYFANALHEDYLYAWQNGELSHISYDVPYNFTVKNGKLYFRSKSLFGGAVKEINVTAADTNVNSIADAKGEYLTTDGTNFYYAVNGLTASMSGIYKLTLPQEGEPIVTQLASGKAKYLQYVGGYLYFADGSNGYKLTKISVNGGQKSLVRDEKINCLTADGNYLFYTVNNLLGDYIENYNTQNGTYRKLTIDAGANLVVSDRKLYYINVDLLTSSLRGDGIYYVNAYPTSDSNASGSMLIGDATFSSLTLLDDGYLAFYRIGTTQELLVYELATNRYTNILEGFTPPESIPFSTGSKTATYNGLIYYLDLHREKCLYTYDPQTGATRKMTANKVTDFAIIGDYLYYNAVSIMVNNDLYRVNLKTGGEPEKISTYDANDIVSDGENIFYVEQNAAGARTAIHIIKADGTDTIIYSKGVNNLRFHNGYIYFIDGDDLYRMPAKGYTVDKPELIRKGDVDIFEIADGVIYFREVLLINKQLSKINVDGSGYAVVLKGYDPVDILIEGGYIYFYSDTVKAATAGIFKLSLKGGDPILVLAKAAGSNTYYPTEMVILDGYLYFINYALGGVGGDSHLYRVKLATSAVEKAV